MSILGTIEGAFGDLLGSSPSKVIIHLMEVRYGVKEEGIPDNPERFAYAMREVFGSAGATIFLRAVIDRMRDAPPTTKAEKRRFDKFVRVLEENCRSIETGIE